MTNNMSTPDKCPHCGAIRVEGREYACGFIFREGVKNNPRTHECLLNSEVSAHAATKREMDELKACQKVEFTSRHLTHYAELQAENETLRARVRELEGLKVHSVYGTVCGYHIVKLYVNSDRFKPSQATLGEAMPRKEEG